MIRWLRCLALLYVLTAAPAGSAQVIECPGALPAAALERQDTLKVAERLLQRFSAALGLHGLDAIDEQAILDSHRDHPDQLLTKLAYLTLQCQMVLLGDALAAEERRRAIRRVFLDYVLQPADPAAPSLADYVNAVAASGSVSEAGDLEAAIDRVEFILERSLRRQWQERWFLPPPRARTASPPAAGP
ncbi:MAG: hypothetical protein HC871_03790 [Rhizobiales bacterium]|nr:hypothetical protein [Hyphomicrobiales bacterium]